MANIPLTDLLSGGTNSLRTEVTNIPAVTNANIDIALSALRDAITKTGETVKTLADVVDKLSDVGVTSLPSLIAGSDIVGKFGIDQTTGGTTNGIVNKNASGNEIFTDASPGSMKLTGSYVVVDAVIAQDGTLSSEIDFQKHKYLSFLMPSEWTAATLTIKGSAVASGTKRVIKNDAGVPFPVMTVAVDEIYSVDIHALKIAGVHFLSLEASVAQVTARTIKVMLKA